MAKIQSGEGTDTELLGANHIPGIDYLTVGEYRNTDLVAKILMRLPRAIQALFLLLRLFTYDFVIAQDNLLLGYAVSLCSRLFRLKTRWLYAAMNSSTLMRRHAAHPVRSFLLKTFWASYARIICLSSEQLEDFVRLGIPRTRLMFVPFGVDTSFFQSADASCEEGLVVSVGRDAGRDYTTLFEAAKRTGHTFIVVAGHKNIPPGMPIPANVSVLYNRSLLEIRDLYARARLVVVSSKDASVPNGSDCSGQTVILDALAAGKAVIATRRSWIADYFVPDQDVIIVEPDNPEALAQAINSLWQDAEKRKHLAASGHTKVVARYTTKHFAEALLGLMNSAI